MLSFLLQITGFLSWLSLYTWSSGVVCVARPWCVFHYVLKHSPNSDKWAFEVTKVSHAPAVQNKEGSLKCRPCHETTKEIDDKEERGSLGRMWESVVDLWGFAVCGQRQCAFVPAPSWPYWQTNLWLGGVSVSVLSVGATERNSRGQKKKGLQKWGGVKEKQVSWKKVCETPWDSRKRQWALQCCLPQRFLCGVPLLATAGSTLMLTQTGQKERPQLFTVQWSLSHMDEGNESTLPFGHSAHVSTLVLHQAVNNCELLFRSDQSNKGLDPLQGYARLWRCLSGAARGNSGVPLVGWRVFLNNLV